MDDYKSLSHTKWECKYHVCSFQVPQERALRRTEAVPRGCVLQVGVAEGKPNRTSSSHAGSCSNCGSGRGGDTGVHQEPTARGQAPRPTQPVALIAAFRRLEQLGPRQRPQQPLRAAPSPKPPALPGDTYSPGPNLTSQNAYTAATPPSIGIHHWKSNPSRVKWLSRKSMGVPSRATALPASDSGQQ
jgi:hypothetical protein